MISRAILLAAGQGTRLGPHAKDQPKCLVPLGSRETFLGRLLRQYASAGVLHVTVVTGYRATLVADAVKMVALEVDLVENKLFDRTNNMFSLALALPLDGEGAIVGNADVVYADELFGDFVKLAPLDCIPVQVGAYLDESMKVQVDTDGRIVRIAKDVPRELALGNSLDMYKLSGPAVRQLREIILTDYLGHGRLREWSEVALNDLLSLVRMSAWDVEGRPWIEVDTPEDLEAARLLVRREHEAAAAARPPKSSGRGVG